MCAYHKVCQRSGTCLQQAAKPLQARSWLTCFTCLTKLRSKAMAS